MKSRTHRIRIQDMELKYGSCWGPCLPKEEKKKVPYKPKISSQLDKAIWEWESTQIHNAVYVYQRLLRLKHKKEEGNPSATHSAWEQDDNYHYWAIIASIKSMLNLKI